jgi:hypothetical protein
MKLSEALWGYELAQRAGSLSENTVNLYLHWLGRMVDFLGDIDLSAITEERLQSFMAYIKNDYRPSRPDGDDSPLSPSSVRTCFLAVKSFI